MTTASAERAELADLAARVGSEAPTLLPDWSVADLVAHIVVRERRPDAVAGIGFAPLAGYTEKIRQQYASKPWEELLDMLRQGPPAWSPTTWPGLGKLDDVMNTLEFLIHTEDIRRAQPGEPPRATDYGTDEAIWRMLRPVAKLMLRKTPVNLRLTRAAGGNESPNDIRLTAKATTWQSLDEVVVSGPPLEIALHVFGRDQGRGPGVVHVQVTGPEQAIAAYQLLKRSA